MKKLYRILTDKESVLLFNELSLRLPYKVKVGFFATDLNMQIVSLSGICFKYNAIKYDVTSSSADFSIGDISLALQPVFPLLFPLKSMTDIQREEFSEAREKDFKEIIKSIGSSNEDYIPLFGKNQLKFLLENHFDFNDMISKKLAIDIREFF